MDQQNINNDESSNQTNNIPSIEDLKTATKKLIIEDKDFRKSMLFDLAKYAISSLGVGWLAILLIISIFGYSSLGDISKSAMDSYLEKQSQVFKEQFRRLSQIPSYATKTQKIRVNDSLNNFVAFPFYKDINRQATEEECDWFVTLEVLKGDDITVFAKIDTLNGNAGLRFTSKNLRNESSGNRVAHGPGYTPKEIFVQMEAKVFIFASREIDQTQ